MKQKLLLGMAFVYILMQFIAPAVGLALALNFDASCYSGSISFLERVSDNSSCGASGSGHVGFPFILTFDYNTAAQKLVVLVLNLLPLGILASFLVTRNRASKKA
jgi:hypothetical protein